MPHRRQKRQGPRAHLGLLHGDLVHVAGTPIAFAAETDRVAANIDHFWITLSLGAGEPIRLALSTHSRQSAAAGFDARLRVGILPSSWTELPPPALTKSPGLDYRVLESAGSITYLEHERTAVETLLTERCRRAVFVEAWGELYVRTHVGIHQIHSMGASSSVPRDLIGRDGAIRFYFPGGKAELLLFKYSGQV